MALKTNKAWAKRIKVTRNGKLVCRAKGQNHLNAKQSGNTRRRKRRMVLLKVSRKAVARFLPYK